MSVITGLVPQTEVEAVNAMLGVIGEAPLPLDADLETLKDADLNVGMSVEILRGTARAALSRGWRFNTLMGFELLPTATYAWEDSDGNTTTLNVFKVPDGTLAWKQTRCQQNSGVDFIEMRSLKYKETGEAVKVLFDRVYNRDGAEASRFAKVYIDRTVSVDFEDMPETARCYIAVTAGRRLAQKLVGSQELAGFTLQDESAALLNLTRDQGLKKKLNLFQSVDGQDALGRREEVGGGGTFYRVFPGGAP